MLVCDFDLCNRSSRRSDILDCARLAATEFDLDSADTGPLMSPSVSELCFVFFCKAFNRRRACISCSFNCSVSSSSSSADPSKPISSGRSAALFRTELDGLKRFVGDGDGEARSARR